MQFNRKRFKKLRHHLKKIKESKHPANKIDKIMKNMHYKQKSIKEISQHGSKLIRPAKDYLNREQESYQKALSYKADAKKKKNLTSKQSKKCEKIISKYESVDSRALGFGNLKQDSQKNVTLCGFVGGYKLVFNHFYHQVAIYLLLRYVSGITYNHKFKYITNHLWIDTNLANRLLFYDTVVGIGDCVVVRGRPNRYSGYIGNMKGIKTSLDDAVITRSGYPLIKNGRFAYQAIPYNHGQQYLYFANAKMNPNIVLGNEISAFDRNHIRGDKYYVGYSNEFDIGTILHKGLKFKAYKHNPRLIVTFHNYKKQIIKNIRWTTNNYSIRQGMVLTSAKNYQHHPKRTERSIDKRLKKAMQVSYQYIIKSAM